LNRVHILEALGITLWQARASHAYYQAWPLRLDWQKPLYGAACLVILPALAADPESERVLQGMLSVLKFEPQLAVLKLDFDTRDVLKQPANIEALKQQLASFQPQRLLCMGQDLAQALLNTHKELDALRQQEWSLGYGLLCHFTYDPPTLVRCVEHKPKAYRDLCLVKSLISTI